MGRRSNCTHIHLMAETREVSAGATEFLDPLAEKRTCYANMNQDGTWDKKAEWANEAGVYTETEDGRGRILEIDGKAVMEQWETPYMRALATAATKHGGVILEVGFGLGLSATCIEENQVEKHIIIEANKDVITNEGGAWLEKLSPEQRARVEFKQGMWQDVVASLPDNSLDAVLYDPYPNNTEEQHIHQFLFIKEVFPKLKKGALLVYCNLTSLGVLRGDYDLPDAGITREQAWALVWAKKQVPHLEKIGFSKLDYELFQMPETPMTPGGFPPKSCQYYQWDQGLVPLCYK